MKSHAGDLLLYVAAVTEGARVICRSWPHPWPRVGVSRLCEIADLQTRYGVPNDPLSCPHGIQCPFCYELPGVQLVVVEGRWPGRGEGEGARGLQPEVVVPDARGYPAEQPELAEDIGHAVGREELRWRVKSADHRMHDGQPGCSGDWEHADYFSSVSGSAR
jgi:hypothetical protein